MLTRIIRLCGAALVTLAIAVSGAVPALAQQTVPPTPTPVAVDTFDAGAASGRTGVKWYV